MQTTTMALPRSGCFTMRIVVTPSANASGRTTARSWSGAGSRRATRSAANNKNASFMSSEGCTVIGPAPSQRLAPPEPFPT